jgi:serine/threonine protein kinase
VVQIFNLGQQDDSFFLAMEYIHGEDARRVWKRSEQLGNPLPIPLVCRVVMDACAGLDYAHKKADPSGNPLNIVHRDISPQNILITFDGGVKVVDFGIAKAADQATVTRSGVLKGKYSYMSPEQAAGKRVDCRSDIFALGVVLYELLTGTRLFKRQSDIQTLNAVTTCEVTPPSQVNPRVPVDLEPIVMKALAREPEHRFQEAVELQLALEDWLIERRMPSSSAHLSAFMQEIYAERLAQEALEGTVLIDELDSVSSKAKEEGSPNRVRPSRPSTPRPATPRPATGPRPTASLKPPPLPPGPPDESTLSERPNLLDEEPEDATRSERSSRDLRAAQRRIPEPRLTVAQTPRALSTSQRAALPSEPGELSLTESALEKRQRPVPVLVWAALVAFALGGAGFLAYPLLKGSRPPPHPVSTGTRPAVVESTVAGPAVVRIDSSPTGARVTFDGEKLAQPTPCALPTRPAGTYSLVLEREGSLPLHGTVEVPAAGAVTLPSYALQPSAVGGDSQGGEKTPDETGESVHVVRHTTHPEHRDAHRGKVSLVLDSNPSGARLSVNGAAQGVTPATVELPARSTAQVRLELAGYRALSRRIRVGSGAQQAESLRLEPLPTPTSRGTGTVAFVVSPWAEVSCGAYKFGDTPFPEKTMAAGSYQCSFTNPKLGTRTRAVEVRPNARIVVAVKFTDSP